MAAGAVTGANTTIVLSDLTKLSPMVWLDGARVASEQYQNVMDLVDTDNLDQFNRDYGSIAAGGFGEVTSEGADYQVQTHNQGDTLSLAVVKRTSAYSITEDLTDGNKYREALGNMRNLGERLFRTRARDVVHHIFTFGFSTTYTDSSGATVTNGVANASTEAIFADTHTMADTSTYDNLLADTAIGEANLRSLVDLTTGFLDEDGYRVPWGAGSEKLLLTSEDVPMMHAGARLTTQEWNYSSQNRDINVFRGQYMHTPLFFLNTLATGAIDTTKDKYYIVVDRSLMKRLAIFADHTKPTLSGPFEDNWNGGMLWRAKTRYDKGVQAAHIGAGCAATT